MANCCLDGICQMVRAFLTNDKRVDGAADQAFDAHKVTRKDGQSLIPSASLEPALRRAANYIGFTVDENALKHVIDTAAVPDSDGYSRSSFRGVVKQLCELRLRQAWT
eukprot:TRINITY_DN57152_c0_g1_i1.p1 TRINITY_DN57152_c0_g1~~TRINITY_DN57152_c0_g1_i1.p1  ORF type:complete len:127 (-),score=14.80 TRINITY_DN57152_c0_g1_i1:290-613(-)